MALPPAVEVVNPDGQSPYVLTCEHASNFIPAHYDGLGLPAEELDRHIAWDIGAAVVARRLSAAIDAPLFLSGYSRLLIDCNRPVGSPTSIPVVSETTAIPGNQGLTPAEAGQRASRYYWPFQQAVSAHLDQRRSEGRRAVIVGIHSFTPVYKASVRPWQAGVLFRRAAAFGNRLVNDLDRPDRLVSANEPYVIEDDGDYTVPVHGEARGLDAVLLEIRQDLIAGQEGANQWADLIAEALCAQVNAAG